MKVLCIAPRFAPLNAADSHRLRLLLPYLTGQGCDVEVLTVDPAHLEGLKDSWLTERLPKHIPIHTVTPWRLRGWGVKGLAQNSFGPLYSKGSELLSSGRFQLVFFSTTEFLLHGLGPLWRRKFGTPFCMDYQDPWVSDYYHLNPHAPPPGGRLKYGLSLRLHKMVERTVAPQCSGFLAVSESYLQALDSRYGRAVGLQPRRVAGFPAEPAEFAEFLTRSQSALLPHKIWRYIGRGGAIMGLSIKAFFRAWRIAIDTGLIESNAIRFEAIGTNYQPDSTERSFLPLASEFELSECVSEQPERVAYSNTLDLLAQSDALIVFGSDDSGYTASKIYSYVLARKPLLVILHRDSNAIKFLRSVGAAVCVTFDACTSEESLSREIVKSWFSQGCTPAIIPMNDEAFETYTAASQSAMLANWFRAVLEHKPGLSNSAPPYL